MKKVPLTQSDLEKSSQDFHFPNLMIKEDKNNLTKDDTEKAEVLADFFSSVFTKEPEGHWDLPEGEFIHNGQVDLSKKS